MKRTFGMLSSAVGMVLLAGLFHGALAQQVQVPTLQVCNETTVAGKANVRIMSRSDTTHTGSFDIAVELSCKPSGYPGGSLSLNRISMSDSSAGATITATTFEQVTSIGKHTPTAFINGRCKAAEINGCRFWLMIADNKGLDREGTPDIVSFLVVDGTGRRVAYGTGPVLKGDIKVTSAN